MAAQMNASDRNIQFVKSNKAEIMRIMAEVGQASEASVAGSVVNLAGQRQALAFRAIREADALYYLAEFAIAGEDLYRFELEVQPARAARAESIRFQQPLVGR